jgi:UDP-N-acetyl-D-mannosaminuronic acid dehydrogenase
MYDSVLVIKLKQPAYFYRGRISAHNRKKITGTGAGVTFTKICVIGLGYIGLPTASTFASRGVKVIGVDVNPHIIQTLRNGAIHIYEPGLRDLEQAAIQSGNLQVRETPEEADAFIIAVPTPFYDDKRADMRFVTSAAESIVPHLRQGNLVVLESTSPPLTTANLVRPILEKSGLKAGVDFKLAYSPERVLPGQILRELVENARVIGGIDQASAEAGRDLYATFVKGEIVLTDATTAEMVKLMENTYRDVNIAIANEFSRLADRFGVDVWEAISLANRHPRVKILQPGPGVGGHCISVDPWFLVEAAPDLTLLILNSRKVNDSQPEFVVSLVKRELGDLKGKRIAGLGMSYKPDVDDMRESPAIEVIHRLSTAGAEVRVFDPFKTSGEIDGIPVQATLKDAVTDAKMVVLLVAHHEFRNLQPVEFRQISSASAVLDTVNVWDRDAWQSAGYRFLKLGDAKHA